MSTLFHPLWLSWVAACSVGTEDSTPSVVVEQGSFRKVLLLPGELKARRSASLASPELPGQVKVTWIIEEGTQVEEGDLIASFDAGEIHSLLKEDRDNEEIARTKILQKQAQLEVHLREMEGEITRAELSLERSKLRVTDSETVPRVERESARLDVQELELSLVKARSNYESAKLEGEAELQLLQLDAQRARDDVQQLEKKLSSTELRAPHSGLVLLPSSWKGGSRGPVKQGDTLWSGVTVAQLPDLSEMVVEAWVHEIDASLVSEQLPVEVIVDAHPEPAHPGTIEKVANLAIQHGDIQGVKHLKIQIQLEETPDTVKPGMSARVEVLLEELDDVLSVPQEAVFYQGTEPFVYKRSLGRWSPQTVQLGSSNDTHVVVQGLEAGDRLALTDPEETDRGGRGGATP